MAMAPRAFSPTITLRESQSGQQTDRWTDRWMDSDRDREMVMRIKLGKYKKQNKMGYGAGIELRFRSSCVC